MTQLQWARNTLLFYWCLAGVLLGASPTLRAQTTIAQLKTQFEHPPDVCRPMMRWWWFGLAVEKPEIRRELEEMKADGIGGAELAFVYPQVVDDPAKHLVNEPFLSSGMLDNVSYAASEARRTRSSPGRDAGQRLALRRAGHHTRRGSGPPSRNRAGYRAGDDKSAGVCFSGGGVCNFHFARQRRAKALAGIACAVAGGGTNERSAAGHDPSNRSCLYRQPHRPAGETRRRGRRGLGSGSFQPAGRCNPSQCGR